MLEAVVTKYGSPDVIKIQGSDIPEPKDEEVLVKVSYCGINFADIFLYIRIYMRIYTKIWAKLIFCPLTTLECSDQFLSALNGFGDKK